MAAYDDLNTKRIFIVGILSIVVTAVTALAVQVVYYSLVSWHAAELSESSSYKRPNAVLAEQGGEIEKYGVDPETAAVTIPIEKAMQLIAVNNDGDAKAKSTGDGGSDKERHKEQHDDKDHEDKVHGNKKHSKKKHDESTEADAA